MKQIATFITINKLKVKILGVLAGFCPKSARCGICFMGTHTKESVLAKPEYACIIRFSAYVSVLISNVQKKIREFPMVILYLKPARICRHEQDLLSRNHERSKPRKKPGA